jgi:hypothetical protein
MLEREAISKHAYSLLLVLTQTSPKNSDKNLTWERSIEWLNLGLSIQATNVITGYHDDTLLYCGSAMEYEIKKSEILSEIVTDISIFNFLWGSFESLCKSINLEKVPNSIKKRRNFVDDTLFYLKQDYPLIPLPHQYIEQLKELESIVSKSPESKSINFKNLYNSKLLNNTGKALTLIRLIRNDFAHGSYTLPMHDDWNIFGNYKISDHIQKIRLSSSLLLITIQMILITYFKDNQFAVLLDPIKSGDDYINIIDKLFSLHSNEKNSLNSLFFKSSIK